jgi:hypothetical protein
MLVTLVPKRDKLVLRVPQRAMRLARLGKRRDRTFKPRAPLTWVFGSMADRTMGL